ncbi:MAG: alpha/beta fold hydrolase [Gammaproteobacteria bacterium]|nr:alpha/beta fold hydrolase [Gammaproteobacteria bacterium]MBU1777236.1 alpha/beta fold hydrolase [Gammaproteobacteria bacterium]MBU1969470.1 alpha/beta fold hydrolase [Gammaproteobacteria bacterium]
MMELLGLRHRPSGENVRFAAAGLSFAEYVRRTKEMLWQLHAGKNEQEQYVTGNAPFELLPEGEFEKGRDKPFRRGVLLVHGLSDSPYHMRHLAAFFRRNGFRVMALLLPGHGTQPGDLLHMHWQEWARAVAWGADKLSEEVDELYLGGFSAGAALSVLQASRDQRVRGLFLFSPAFEITARAKWANLHKFYSWLLPKAAWVSTMQDRDLYKYESFCKNAAAQMYALTQALPQGEVDIPVFAVASADDATVNSAATLRFMQRATHSCSKLLWYATQKTELPKVEWVNSAVPEQRILSSAHTAIVIPPDDEQYGAAGGYENCLHYLPHDKAGYNACRARAAEVWHGEVHEKNLQRGLLRRLMYNPHYAAMEASMQRFIECLP